MKKSNAYLSVLLAGLLAAAGAQAQSTSAAGSSDGPPKAGEASNQTRGVPNAATTNSPVSEAPILSKDETRKDAHGMSGASATTPVHGKAGEASTMVHGKPNANPDPAATKSRAQVRDEVTMRRAQLDAERATRMMGNTGYGVAVGTPATLPAGSPSVFEGGSPK